MPVRNLNLVKNSFNIMIFEIVKFMSQLILKISSRFALILLELAALEQRSHSERKKNLSKATVQNSNRKNENTMTSEIFI